LIGTDDRTRQEDAMAGAHRIERKRRVRPLVGVLALLAGMLVGGGAAVTASAAADTTTCTPFAVTPPPNPQFLVPYSQQIHVTGGTAPYTFVKAGGTLPTGLSVNKSGLISGLPSKQGEFFFQVQITDSAPTPCAYVAGFFMQVRFNPPTGGNAVLIYLVALVNWVVDIDAPTFVACVEAEIQQVIYSEPPNTDCTNVLFPPLPPTS
jgi:hypothetical protein